MFNTLLILTFLSVSLNIFGMEEENPAKNKKRKDQQTQSTPIKRIRIPKLKGLEDESLQEVYQKLFVRPFPARISNTARLRIPDVGMGCLFVADEKEFATIGTRGLGPCFAVGATGFNGENCVLALAHQSTNIDPVFVLKKIHLELTQKGCSEKSIEIFVFGGQEAYEDDEGLSAETCIFVEEDFLLMADSYNIIGIKFNLVKGEEKDFDVILNKDGMFYGYDLFKALKNYEDAGEDLDQGESDNRT